MTVSRELTARLESVDGLRLTVGADLSRLSTFRIGGCADLLAEVRNEAALVVLLREVAAAGEAFQLLGLGSNVLLPDEGLAGVVARLGGDFGRVTISGRRVGAGAAVTLSKLARETAAAGLAGLEPLSGFPSTVGGAVFMNAGCYGTEIRDVLVETRVTDLSGAVRTLAVTDLGAGYRTTLLQRSGEIVLWADFELERAAPEACLARIEELVGKRRRTLPYGNPNVGSIFRNPSGDHAGRLIDVCGLKGRRCGDAQISPAHGNVIVNLGAARSRDVLELMIAARLEVERRFGVRLEPEVVLTGGLRREWDRRVSASLEP